MRKPDFVPLRGTLNPLLLANPVYHSLPLLPIPTQMPQNRERGVMFSAEDARHNPLSLTLHSVRHLH